MRSSQYKAPADAARTPVIIGVGEITWRQKDAAAGMEPIALMEAALCAAQEDALRDARPHVGAALLQAVDALDVVCEHSWPYDDAPALLASRLHMKPRHRAYAQAGGESPVRLLHEAALRIASGESVVAAVVGAEASYTVAAAARAGTALDTSLNWTPRKADARLLKGADICHPIAVRHGVVSPVHVYAFFENALTAAARQTPAEAHLASARMWAALSEVAAGNPHAWQRSALSEDDIATPGPGNRLIAWPYTLAMVANPLVDMGAAVIVTSLQVAHELGVPEHRLVHIWGGAHAEEPRDYLARDSYAQVPAQEAVLRAAKALASTSASTPTQPSSPPRLMELYSCFPVVPKLAARALDLAPDAAISVTGGLSRFGGPLNNYMGHATAAMVRALRGADAAERGLLYGQGEYLTKHHALVLSRTPSPLGGLHTDGRVQGHADLLRGPAPPLLSTYEGPARIETHTVVYDRDGEPAFGSVIARTPQEARLMAHVPVDDARGIAALTSLRHSPVGLTGDVMPGEDGRLRWRLRP